MDTKPIGNIFFTDKYETCRLAAEEFVEAELRSAELAIEDGRRYELAKMFAVELLRAEIEIARPPIERGKKIETSLARASVSLADALIAALKEEK